MLQSWRLMLYHNVVATMQQCWYNIVAMLPQNWKICNCIMLAQCWYEKWNITIFTPRSGNVLRTLVSNVEIRPNYNIHATLWLCCLKVVSQPTYLHSHNVVPTLRNYMFSMLPQCSYNVEGTHQESKILFSILKIKFGMIKSVHFDL